MKTLGTISLAVLFLLMAGSVATYSQDDSRPSQAQEEKDKARNNDKQGTQEDKAVKQENNDASKPEKRPEQEQPAARQEEHPDNNAAKQEQKQEKQEQKEQRSDQKSDQRMERDQHAAAANQGRRIPDDKFRAHFGRPHTFRVRRTEIINVSQPVVVYGGYSFQLVDAWPSDWGFDDDCYIDYVDGEYFLFDTFHPGIRIAVFIVD